MRIAALLAGALVMLVSFGEWEAARAEESRVYVGVYGGVAVTDDLENVRRQPSGTKLPDLSLTRLGDNDDHELDGLVGGLKVGFMPEREYTWFGLEAEVFVAPTRVEPGQIFEGEEVTLVTLGFHPILRIPWGPFQPYLGVGPSVVWSDGLGGQDSSIGLNMMVGLRILFGERLFIFGEVKRNTVEMDFPAATVDITQHAGVAGIALTF